MGACRRLGRRPERYGALGLTCAWPLLACRADRIEALAADLGGGSIAIRADVTDRDQLVELGREVGDA